MSVPVDQMQQMLEQQPESMSDSDVLHAVTKEIDWASDLRRDDLDGNRARAWRYFEGDLPGVFDDDVSEYFQQVVSHDVADALEATLAEIMPAFAADRPAKFDSEGEGDEDQSAMESDVCNDILMEAGNGFLELTTAAKNALLLRLGALEIIWDDQQEPVYQTVKQVTPPILFQIKQRDPSAEIRPIQGTQRTVAAGGVITPVADFEVRTYRKRGVCRVESVPTDEILVSSDCQGLDFDTARFVGRQTMCSRSDLKAKGYDPEVVDRLPAYTSASITRSRTERERNTWGREKETGDIASNQIMIARCWYRLDEDRDGLTELRHIVVGGTPGSWELLHDEPAEFQPLAVGAGYIWQHMPYGISLYDKLKHVQDMKSKYWRIMLEAGQRAARDRTGLGPGVDQEAWETTHFGGGIPIRSRDDIVPIPNPQFPSEIGVLNEIADKARREGGGGSVDKSASENMPVEAGAHGVERMLSAIEELNSMVARMLAETLVKQSYIKIHTTLRLYGNPFPRLIQGQWQQVNPRQWRPRQKVSVATGLTISERGRLASAMGNIIQNQKELIEKGSTLANEQTLYRALCDQSRLLGIQHPESYMVDPASQDGQQARQRKQQSQQQAEQKEQQAAVLQANLQAQALQALEATKGQAQIAKEQLQQQGELQQLVMKLTQDQRQFQQEMKQKYDALRVELTKAELQHDEKVTGQVLKGSNS